MYACIKKHCCYFFFLRLFPIHRKLFDYISNSNIWFIFDEWSLTNHTHTHCHTITTNTAKIVYIVGRSLLPSALLSPRHFHRCSAPNELLPRCRTHLSIERFLEVYVCNEKKKRKTTATTTKWINTCCFIMAKRPMTWSDSVFVNGIVPIFINIHTSFFLLHHRHHHHKHTHTYVVCMCAQTREYQTNYRALQHIHIHMCSTFISFYYSYRSSQRESWQIVITIIHTTTRHLFI